MLLVPCHFANEAFHQTGVSPTHSSLCMHGLTNRASRVGTGLPYKYKTRLGKTSFELNASLQRWAFQVENFGICWMKLPFDKMT